MDSAEAGLASKAERFFVLVQVRRRRRAADRSQSLNSASAVLRGR